VIALVVMGCAHTKTINDMLGAEVAAATIGAISFATPYL
jgi:hypothetical protein